MNWRQIGAGGALRGSIGRIALLIVLGCVAACANAPPATIVTPTPTPIPSAPPPPPAEQPYFVQSGLASLYGPKQQGQRTACGEPLDIHAMTAAHRSLPFQTILRVTAPSTGKTVKVRINDRGPFIAGRIVDLSEAAALALGIAARGTAPVRIEVYAADQP